MSSPNWDFTLDMHLLVSIGVSLRLSAPICLMCTCHLAMILEKPTSLEKEAFP